MSKIQAFWNLRLLLLLTSYLFYEEIRDFLSSTPIHPSVKWVTGFFPGGNAVRVWCRPPTTIYCQVKERVEQYFLSPLWTFIAGYVKFLTFFGGSYFFHFQGQTKPPPIRELEASHDTELSRNMPSYILPYFHYFQNYAQYFFYETTCFSNCRMLGKRTFLSSRWTPKWQ